MASTITAAANVLSPLSWLGEGVRWVIGAGLVDPIANALRDAGLVSPKPAPGAPSAPSYATVKAPAPADAVAQAGAKAAADWQTWRQTAIPSSTATDWVLWGALAIAVAAVLSLRRT